MEMITYLDLYKRLESERRRQATACPQFLMIAKISLVSLLSSRIKWLSSKSDQREIFMKRLKTDHSRHRF